MSRHAAPAEPGQGPCLPGRPYLRRRGARGKKRDRRLQPGGPSPVSRPAAGRAASVRSGSSGTSARGDL